VKSQTVLGPPLWQHVEDPPRIPLLPEDEEDEDDDRIIRVAD
jgi:hypothetical protein